MRRLALLLGLAISGCAVPAKGPLTLAVLAERDVEGLDPHTAGQIWQTQMVLAHLYEALIGFDPQMRLIPSLAVSWSNPDERTWEFRLRDGARFHDGTLMEAEDVAASLRRARDDPRSVVRAALAGVEEISVLARDRVRLRTAEPDAALLSRLREVFVASRHCLARGADGFAIASCGTGPYRLDHWQSSAFVDLVRFDGYWGRPPEVAQARFVARAYGAADADQLRPAGSGLVFWTRPGGPLFARALGEAVAHRGPGLAVVFLSFDLHGTSAPGVSLPEGVRGNPFLDERVRTVVDMALDRPALVRSASAGEGAVASQLVPKTVFGWDPGLKASSPELDGARRILQATPYAAGFEVGLDVREGMAGLAESVARDLQPLGIRVRVDRFPDAQFFARANQGQSALAIHRFSCWTGDAQALLDKAFHSRDPRHGYGIFNYSYEHPVLPGLDEEIDGARRELRLSERARRLQQVIRHLAEVRLAVPLLQEPDIVFTSPEVRWTSRADTFRMVSEAGRAH